MIYAASRSVLKRCFVIPNCLYQSHWCTSWCWETLAAIPYRDINFILFNWSLRNATYMCLDTLRPRQNGHHFPGDILKCILFNENVLISIEISMKFVPEVQINNIPSLIQLMAWHQPGTKPLSEPMMVTLGTNICITQPQCVKRDCDTYIYALHISVWTHNITTTKQNHVNILLHRELQCSLCKIILGCTACNMKISSAGAYVIPAEGSQDWDPFMGPLCFWYHPQCWWLLPAWIIAVTDN